MIVLFTSTRSGTVVVSSEDDDRYCLGFHAHDWDSCEWSDRWEIFAGSIKLQNGP